MAQLTVTGMRSFSFNDDLGRAVEGLSLFILEPLKTGANGMKAQGFTTVKQFVPKDSPLYPSLLSADYSKPIEADFRYDVIPGKKPVLTDIVLLDDVDE
jgi:hypothetical protein